MTLRDALRAIKRLWIVIVAAVAVSVGVMWAITPVAVDTARKVGSYQAIAVLLVEPQMQRPPAASATPTPRASVTPRRSGTPAPTPSPTPTPPSEVTDSTEQAVSRVALLVHTGEIPHRALQALGEQGDPAILVSDLNVDADVSTGTVQISMRSKDGIRATEVVNTFARETVRYFEQPRPEVVNGKVTLIDEATPLPFAPANDYVVPPDRDARLLIAALLGLLAGAALAVLLDRLDSRIRTAKEVRKILGLPVIAEVPRGLRRVDVAVRDQPASPQSDAYRIAESTLASLSKSTGADVKVISVTSSVAKEDAAASVANLAAAFAEDGSSVLVLEANFRAPTVHRLLDVPAGVGFADWITDAATATSFDTLARPTRVPGVRLITAGSAIDEPAALASQLGPVLTEARDLADYVIVDAPPLLEASEAFDVMPHADAVVVIVRYNTLTRPIGSRVGELLQRFKRPVLSAILVGVPRSRRRRKRNPGRRTSRPLSTMGKVRASR